MPVTSAQSRSEAIESTRNRLTSAAPIGTQVSRGIIESLEKQNETQRLVNSWTIVGEPCSTIRETWDVRYEVQYIVRFEVVEPNGTEIVIGMRSGLYFVREKETVTRLDCPGAELEPIPEYYCSLLVDGIEIWRGASATTYGGIVTTRESLAWLQTISRHVPSKEESDLLKQDTKGRGRGPRS